MLWELKWSIKKDHHMWNHVAFLYSVGGRHRAAWVRVLGQVPGLGSGLPKAFLTPQGTGTRPFLGGVSLLPRSPTWEAFSAPAAHRELSSSQPPRLSQRGSHPATRRVSQVRPAVGVRLPGDAARPPTHQARTRSAHAHGAPPRPHRAPAPNAPNTARRAMEPAAVGAVLALPFAFSGAFPAWAGARSAGARRPPGPLRPPPRSAGRAPRPRGLSPRVRAPPSVCV